MTTAPIEAEIPSAAAMEIEVYKRILKRWGQDATEEGFYPPLMAVVRILQFYIMALEHTEKLPHPIPLRVDGVAIAYGMVAPAAVGEWLGKAFKELFGHVFHCSDGFAERFAAETGLIFETGLAQIGELEDHLAGEKEKSSDLKDKLKAARDKLGGMSRDFHKAKKAQQAEVARLHDLIKELDW